MKLLLLLTFFCGLFLQTAAQKDSLSQLFIKNHCGESHISISRKFLTSKEKIPPFFSHFEVVDLRQDTSRLGFYITSNYRRQFVFKESVSNTVLDFFNDYVQPGGTRSFLILIKKFWLYDNIPSTGKSPDGARGGRIEFRGEAFLQTDAGYLPFAFLDTVIISPRSVKDMSLFRLPDLLFNFLQKIAFTDETLLNRKSSFTLNELELLNKKRFDYPMDTAQVLQNGVYANVEEFRNNRPSMSNYEIRSDENGLTQIYLKDEKGQSYFSRKIWGYCDGKQCYTMMDGNLFPVLSVNHAFYVFGSREYQMSMSIAPIVLLPFGLLAYENINKKVYRKMHLFSLDPYSGKIY